MKPKFALPMMLFVTLALPMAAQAQGTVRGAQEGAEAGARAARPVGAIVGGTVGAATGTIGRILGVEDRPRFREYVIHEHPRAYHYSGDFRVGVVLPETVTYYDVPAEYHVAGHRSASVNDRIVLVEPRVRQIMEIE